jgi:hypothetical protein
MRDPEGPNEGFSVDGVPVHKHFNAWEAHFCLSHLFGLTSDLDLNMTFSLVLARGNLVSTIARRARTPVHRTPTNTLNTSVGDKGRLRPIRTKSEVSPGCPNIA